MSEPTPEFNPLTVFLAELIRRLESVPFEPFTIHMTDGREFYVPTPDHITISRKLRQISYETDEPRIHDINPVHVVRIERGKRRRKAA
jgi:hypothetical protein